jgi:hypothetical protein
MVQFQLQSSYHTISRCDLQTLGPLVHLPYEVMIWDFSLRRSSSGNIRCKEGLYGGIFTLEAVEFCLHVLKKGS